MKHPIRILLLTVAVATLAIIGIHAIGAPPASMDNREATVASLSESETQAVKAFEVRLAEYKTLHQQLEGNVGALPENATPEEIDKHRASLRAMIQTARKGAKQGDFLNPGMVSLIRRVCATEVSGKEGQEVKATIMDENPGVLPEVNINDRYPDGVPVTSMPAQLLDSLPKLEQFMEYRFLGKRLVLVDAAAGVVLDITPGVLP